MRSQAPRTGRTRADRIAKVRYTLLIFSAVVIFFVGALLLSPDPKSPQPTDPAVSVEISTTKPTSLLSKQVAKLALANQATRDFLEWSRALATGASTKISEPGSQSKAPGTSQFWLSSNQTSLPADQGLGNAAAQAVQQGLSQSTSADAGEVSAALKKGAEGVQGTGSAVQDVREGSGPSPLVLPKDKRSGPGPGLRRRCAGARGNWCQKALTQKPIPAKPPIYGSKTCPNGCNNVGNCNADTGLCECDVGWKGSDCSVRQKRPCTNGWRNTGNEPNGEPEKWSTPGWTASRCAGICDEDTATCYCNGTMGRIPAPPGSPPGTPPVQQGRPMILNSCQPNKDENGNPANWGMADNKLLFDSTTGWCMAENPTYKCPCIVDGLGGANCEEKYENTCVNQCSGHGECYLGFCRCHPGYYGHDCVRRVAGAAAVPGKELSQPWLKQNIIIPAAAADPPQRKLRFRPLIFVYDTPSEYNSRMLQYRVAKSACFYRTYDVGNGTGYNGWTYDVESAMHEMMLQSEHRTFDPEEADYFYVPVYTSCFMHPVYGWADHPWWGGPGGLRVMHGVNMLLEAKRWLQANHPWWDRRGGKDHIWLISHDEGSCWAPSEIRPSIILSHWGRKDLNHTSNTAYKADDYSQNITHPEYYPAGFTKDIVGHACYNPKKDLIVPGFKGPFSLMKSPLLGATPVERTKLLFFRGDVGVHRLPNYSRGIRQRLYQLTKELNWNTKYNVSIGTYGDVPGDYSGHLASSRYCLVAPGDGWSPRAEDAVRHGCVPVVIQDNVDPVFATLLNWEKFSVRIAEKDMDNTPEILMKIPIKRLNEMQRNLVKVWHRFHYTRLPQVHAHMKGALEANQKARSQTPTPKTPASFPLPHDGPIDIDDGFSTIMQWLYSRIAATRG